MTIGSTGVGRMSRYDDELKPRMKAPTCIAALSVVRGELEVPVAALAEVHGTSEDAVRRSLDVARVYSSSKDPHELAMEAALDVLARGDVQAQSLSVVIMVGGNPLRLQHALGAVRAVALDGGVGCAALIAALRTADQWIRDEPELENVLVAVGEKYVTTPTRTIGVITESVMRDVFSDGASALLMRRGDSGTTLLGFGMATNGTYWDYWDKPSAGGPTSSDLHVMGAALPLFREAAARCLRNARLDREQIDFVVFPAEGTLPITFARAIGIPKHKVFRVQDGPSHIGASDLVFSLEQLVASGAGRPGTIVLLCARTIGVVSFVAVRL